MHELNDALVVPCVLILIIRVFAPVGEEDRATSIRHDKLFARGRVRRDGGKRVCEGDDKGSRLAPLQGVH